MQNFEREKSSGRKLIIFCNFSDSPVLRLIKRTECLSTLSIVLTCTVSGELFKYGFRRWIHSVNGVIIRKLTGLIAENTSSIIIKSCGYQDAGSYTCEAWNEYRMETILINKTSLVKVLGMYSYISKACGLKK